MERVARKGAEEERKGREEELSIIKRLRKENMGFYYDISRDYFYNEGRKQAEKEIIRKVAVRMLEGTTFSIEKIAEILGVTTDYAKQVEKDLKR